MMKKSITLRIKRYDPSARQTRWQEYELDVPDQTILDCLRYIHDEIDPSLAFRAQCRSGICGACAMRINGQARLACKTFLSEVMQNDQVVIEPLVNLPVQQDLIVKDKEFWEQIETIKPWIIRQDEEKSAPVRQESVRQDSALRTQHSGLKAQISPSDSMKAGDCIMCAACYSDCETHAVKPENYAGPIGFVQSWRFLSDFRDQATIERLQLLEDNGIWSCMHMSDCSEVCPKRIRIIDIISQIRNLILANGLGKNPGGRHVRSFCHGVRKTGKLNEFWTHVKTRRLGFILDIPTGLMLILHGKIPWPWGQRAKNSQEVETFFKISSDTKE